MFLNPCGSEVKGLSFTPASEAQGRSSHPAWASTRTPDSSKLAQRVRKESGTEVAPHRPRPGSQPAASIRSSVRQLVLVPPVDAELLAPRLAHRSAPRTRTPVLRPSVRPRTRLLPGSWNAANVTSGVVAKQPNGLATTRLLTSTWK